MGHYPSLLCGLLPRKPRRNRDDARILQCASYYLPRFHHCVPRGHDNLRPLRSQTSNGPWLIDRCNCHVNCFSHYKPMDILLGVLCRLWLGQRTHLSGFFQGRMVSAAGQERLGQWHRGIWLRSGLVHLRTSGWLNSQPRQCQKQPHGSISWCLWELFPGWSQCQSASYVSVDMRDMDCILRNRAAVCLGQEGRQD